MVLAERYCLKCGSACLPAASACAACGASLKATIPLDDEPDDTYPSLRLAQHLQENQLFKERYRIVRRVGVGGFGAVYEAEDTLEQRQVAIKEIGLAGLNPQQVIEVTGSFNREVQLLSILEHSGIPHMYGQLTDAEHWYLVMDFIAGETLEDLLTWADGSCLPLEQALHIAEQICDVLAYLHSRQPAVIFRDIKPTNIMLTPEQRLYLIDFGVARQYKPDKLKDTIAFGSPGYAAPEQYGRAQTTPRADIYSLGALLHQMLTGCDPSLTPFHFQHLRTYNSDLPVELEKLVEQMLELDMELRPANVGEVKHKLQAIAALPTTNRQRKMTRQQTTNRQSGHARSLPPRAAASTLANAFSTIGVTVYIYRGHATPIRALAWSPDGRSIASCDDDRFVSIWNAFQPSPSRIFSPGSGLDGVVNDLAWSPDGRVLAIASRDHIARLVQLDAQPRWWQMLAISLGARVHAYEHHKSPVNALSWSPDGQRIASAEEKGAVHIWNAHTREKLLTYYGHSAITEDVAWSPNGSQIASCSLDHTVRVWSAVNKKNLWRWRPKGSFIVHTLAWSPNAHYLACGTNNGVVRVWDIPHNRHLSIYQNHTRAVKAVSWSPDGRRIASAGTDGTIHVWHALDGKDAFIYRNHERGSITTVAWSPDGQHLASAGQDADVHVWKTV